VTGPPPVVSVVPTNPVVVKIVDLTPTNPPAVLPESSGFGSQGSLLVGAGLLGAAIALGLVFWLRPHRKDASLITRSLNERK
jgi:hypothetical protein